MYLVNVNDTVFTIQTLEWLQQLFILEYKFAIIAVDYMEPWANKAWPARQK